MNSRLATALLGLARGLTLGLASSLVAAAAHAADGAPVRFLNDWKWEGQAAPLLLAADAGYFAEEGLDVTLDPGTGSVAALPKVASGEYDFGSADINSLIRWRVENPDVDLRAIYIIYNAPPFAVIGRPSLGVTGPLDLEGHVLGAPSADGAFAQWPAFVRANGILADRVTIEDVGFPVREPMLASGDVDAITGFSFTSVIGLEERGVPPEDISLMLMSDFGLDLYGNAIVVNPEFADANPGAVRAFLRAAIRGYQETIRNPTAAVSHVLDRNPEASEAIELRRLVMAIGHHIVTDEVRASGLGAVVESRLDKAIGQLAEIHGIDEPPAAAEVFDASYLPELGRRLLPSADESPETAPPVPPGAERGTAAGTATDAAADVTTDPAPETVAEPVAR